MPSTSSSARTARFACGPATSTSGSFRGCCTEPGREPVTLEQMDEAIARRARAPSVKGLDTNVLVRYLTEDDPVQARRAAAWIATTVARGDRCFISPIVLCELALGPARRLSDQQARSPAHVRSPARDDAVRDWRQGRRPRGRRGLSDGPGRLCGLRHRRHPSRGRLRPHGDIRPPPAGRGALPGPLTSAMRHNGRIQIAWINVSFGISRSSRTSITANRRSPIAFSS